MVVFDRGGFRYEGPCQGAPCFCIYSSSEFLHPLCFKALAEAARTGGLQYKPGIVFLETLRLLTDSMVDLHGTEVLRRSNADTCICKKGCTLRPPIGG